MCVCVYLEAAVATVFEIATFPIKNGFFSFLNFFFFQKNFFSKPLKIIIFRRFFGEKKFGPKLSKTEKIDV